MRDSTIDFFLRFSLSMESYLPGAVTNVPNVPSGTVRHVSRHNIFLSADDFLFGER